MLNCPACMTLVERVFGLALAAFSLTVFICGLWPDVYALLMPIPYLDLASVRYAGVGLLLASLGWTLAAQAQMGVSWRIGIDNQNPSALVTDGVFRLSRNPIFLGMRLTMLGLFCVIPNAVTLSALALGDVMAQIQARLEEEHLTKTHGDSYRDYCQRTRRWL